MTVDPTTGAVRLRAIFPNPDGLLLPGMYVRATVIEGVDPHGILAPQQGVGHDPKGEPTALVVDDKNIARLRVLKTGRAVGGDWQVLDGLKPGDKLIVEGLQKAQPDMPVTPMPAANVNIGRPLWGFRASSSTGRSSPGSSPSSSCWRAASPPSTCRSSNIPPSPRLRWWSAPSIPAPTPQTLQNSVTQVIEQQLTGLDNLLYFSSASNADGSVAITATFAAGTNPDIAQVQVQNKVQQAIPQLPAQVQQQGITVAKAQSNFILIVAVYDDSGRYNNVDISDFITRKMQDPLSRASPASAMCRCSARNMPCASGSIPTSCTISA